jgi:phosphoenolpyruvate-protein kinase (PTS system EI component)
VPSAAGSTKPDLKLGVCGEHGGDPESIDLFYKAGLDYVSCSPFRVPIARLAAAQAIIGTTSTTVTRRSRCVRHSERPPSVLVAPRSRCV